MKKAYLNWSSGKDAALALYYSQQDIDLQITKLVTTINGDLDRITMHGVRKSLLEEQARQLGLPLEVCVLSGNTGMDEYNRKMQELTGRLIWEGFEVSVFGDIFLQDLKNYREQQLKKAGLQAKFPLWKRDTLKLISEFIDLGFKAVVVCTNSKYLDDSFCGRLIDKSFIKELPENVDPCGENGEFHTFVYDGPVFNSSVKFQLGEKVQRSYARSKDKDDCFDDDSKQNWDTEFCFCDLIPGN